MRSALWLTLAGWIVLLAPGQGQAQVPALVSYQGRVLVSGTNFSGAGQFKFALVSADGSQTYWLNGPDNNVHGQPDTNVVVSVTGGLFIVALGDTSLAGMAALPLAVFTNPAMYLRIWFNDGVHGNQQLAPDQRLTSAPYAILAANVSDGAITPSKLATNTAAAVTGALSNQVSNLGAQLGTLTSQFNTLSNQYNSAVTSGLTAASIDPLDAGLGAKGYQLFSTILAPGWVTSLAGGAPSPRSGQAGCWTGQELMIWGGSLGASGDTGGGGRYRPDFDHWQLISTVNAPSAREQHSAVWSGQEMVVWGGIASGNYLNTGARFNPASQLWTVLSTNAAPGGRIGHVAAWSGSRMVVWGGRNGNGLLSDGALYDPVADQWTALSLGNAPAARSGATVVGAGNRLIVWGGENETGGLNTGAQLLLDTNGLPTAWMSLSTLNAPAGRKGHAAIWTGQKMLVWGGWGGNYLGDGAAYDPVANAWSPIALTNAPMPRTAHSWIWTGVELLVFGGETASGTAVDGAAYNPATDKWRPLSGAGTPLACSGATAVWSGTELLLFGGLSNGVLLGSLQRLNPQPTWYLYRKP